ALAALQRVQVQLRQALRENEDLRSRAARDAGDKVPAERWRTRINGLLQVGIELNQVQDFHTLMDRILDESRHLLNADAGTIFVREGDRLRFAFFQNETLARRTRTGETPPMQTFRIPINERSIAGWVALTGQPVNITDTDRLDPSLPFRSEPPLPLRSLVRPAARIQHPQHARDAAQKPAWPRAGRHRAHQRARRPGAPARRRLHRRGPSADRALREHRNGRARTHPPDREHHHAHDPHGRGARPERNDSARRARVRLRSDPLRGVGTPPRARRRQPRAPARSTADRGQAP
ncbi:MAG: GAF domain-containing protein, partial [Phycisphaerae bacterium]|nr:GAF domain-containing protein [Phycisphaerae bacterium]